MTAAKKKPWKHVGGGCKIGGSCDDEYRHDDSDRRLTCRTTAERHFDMPRRVAGPAELRRLRGVTNIRISKAPDA